MLISWKNKIGVWINSSVATQMWATIKIYPNNGFAMQATH